MRQEIVKGRKVFKSNDSSNKLDEKKTLEVNGILPVIDAYLAEMNETKFLL